jgi:prepilin-type N-terminal cleavage/methylation domain-containing protein
MRTRRGFTLIEITVAITILAILVVLLFQVMEGMVRGRQMVQDEGLRKPKVANALLGQFIKDLRYLYWGGLQGDAGFLGRSQTMGGKDADRIDFVTARMTRTVPLEEGGRLEERKESPLTEVGYACRPSENGPYLELYRREDPYVDDDPTEGGQYTLIYDKIREFDLRYFPIPEETLRDRTEGEEEWDSRLKRKIPYAIILKINFDVDDQSKESEQKDPERIYRIVLLKGGDRRAVPWGGAAPAMAP